MENQIHILCMHSQICYQPMLTSKYLRSLNVLLYGNAFESNQPMDVLTPEQSLHIRTAPHTLYSMPSISRRRWVNLSKQPLSTKGFSKNRSATLLRPQGFQNRTERNISLHKKHNTGTDIALPTCL